MKPVSCDHVTSFNYDDKKARDVGLTCWCHLSNNMPDSIFHESMRQGITFFFLMRGDTSCFPQDERNGISFITIKSVDLGKPYTITGLGRWDWLAFSEIWSLKHVSEFQTKSFIVGFLCLCMCVLFLTRDAAFLFNTICLRVVANGFYYNSEPR